MSSSTAAAPAAYVPLDIADHISSEDGSAAVMALDRTDIKVQACRKRTFCCGCLCLVSSVATYCVSLYTSGQTQLITEVAATPLVVLAGCCGAYNRQTCCCKAS
jgi:hypothetical protein